MIPQDFHLETRFYYKRLNDDEKKLYLYMAELFFNHTFKFFYLFDDELMPTDEEFKSIPCYLYPFREENWANIFKVYDALLWDCPELYFMSNLELRFEKNGLFRAGEGVCDYSEEEIAELDARLDEIVHRFDGIDDVFELELAVHKFITESYDYDHEYKEYPVGDRRGEEIFTVASLLKTGKGVCGGIIRLAQLILQRHGVEVANILAMAGDEGEDLELHSWLAVKIDGDYYHLDITFDENSTLDKQTPQFMHFNITDEEAVETGHMFNHEEYPEIVCNSTKYNYYRYKGLYFESPEDIRAPLSEFLSSSPEAMQGKISYYFRVPKGFDEKAYASVIWSVAKSFGLTNSFYYAHPDGYFSFTAVE